jgi:hypothetical protein
MNNKNTTTRAVLEKQHGTTPMKGSCDQELIQRPSMTDKARPTFYLWIVFLSGSPEEGTTAYCVPTAKTSPLHSIPPPCYTLR